MRKLIITLLCLPMLVGCYVSEEEYKRLKSENEKLKTEIQAKKLEIDELKFGSGRLLLEIQKDFENQEWVKTECKINELIAKHPVASETGEAKKILITVHEEIRKEKERNEIEMAKAEEEARLKREKEEKERKTKIDIAVKSMSKKTDQIENITWFKDKSTNESSINSCLYLYFGQKESRIIGPRLYIQRWPDLLVKFL